MKAEIPGIERKDAAVNCGFVAFFTPPQPFTKQKHFTADGLARECEYGGFRAAGPVLIAGLNGAAPPGQTNGETMKRYYATQATLRLFSHLPQSAFDRALFVDTISCIFEREPPPEIARLCPMVREITAVQLADLKTPRGKSF